jgi:hypothetical protein
VAITNGYATLVQAKAFMGNMTKTADDTLLEQCVEAASRLIDAACNRYFYQDGTTSVRYFDPVDSQVCHVDDISTTTSLAIAVDLGDSGSFTSLSATDYQLLPLNSLSAGQAWPFTELRAVGSYLWPRYGRRRGRVKVTARWGWAAVPEQIYQASLMLTHELYQLREAPFGVAGFGEFGVVRVRDNPKVSGLLDPFMRMTRGNVGGFSVPV